MQRYINVYAYNLIDTIRRGETVHVLDRDTNEVCNVLDLTVEKFLHVLDSLNENRYEMWRAYEVEDTNERESNE